MKRASAIRTYFLGSNVGYVVRYARCSALRIELLERFRAKWIPVRVKKTRQNKKLELRF
jgi:hypothetical protein